MATNIGKYRWTICSLLFFATTVNYLDRQVLSLLKSSLEREFGWSNSDYANIASVFQLIYAFSMLLAGKIIDRLGTKSGYAWAIVIWSLGAIIHAYSITTGKFVASFLGLLGITGMSFSVLGFMASRAVLAFGEAGNFPAAIKATAEYFPKKERALATGIFNSGANVGAILAPLSVPWIAKNWGWQSAFLIIGAVGFVWLIFWFIYYDKPEKQKRLSADELKYINSDLDAELPSSNIVEEKVKWVTALSFKQTWAFAIGKFLTDGVWWFYLFWLPSYLKDQYGMEGMLVTIPLAVLYSMTMIGSIGGGWLPTLFINKGYKPYEGRMKAMLIIAFIPLFVLAAQPLGTYSYWLPVILIGIGASAHQAWSANIFTTVSDMFPKRMIASIIGIGGMAGGIGGVLISKFGGWLFDKYKLQGIEHSIELANQNNLDLFLQKINQLHLTNSNGNPVDLFHKELMSNSSEIIASIKQIDVIEFNHFVSLQQATIHSSMTTAYTIMFSFCATAYLLAWFLLKTLVPKEQIIKL
jgi:ACS family hexuronate transporter-like MFS transporter